MIEELDKKEDLTEDLVENPEPKPEDKVVEVKEDFVSPGVSAPSPSVIDKIKSIVLGKKSEPKATTPGEPKIESQETVSNQVEIEKDEYEEIDPKFIETAQAYGWDDQRIIDYAENHSEEDILLLANLMQDYVNKVKPKSDVADIKNVLGTSDTETFLKLAEENPQVADLLEKILTPLAKRLDDVSKVSEEIKKDSDTRKKGDQLKEDIRNYELANDIFDKSGISSLGKTEEMPKYPDGTFVTNNPMFKTRSEIWNVAQMFYANGGTFKQAVKNALQWYSGENLEKDVKDKIVKDLKKQEERVMPKRQEQTGVKTYTSEEERKRDIVNTALSKYNVELP